MALDRLCGFTSDADDVAALSAGTKLLQGQYCITGYLSSGGFGITYRAKDALGRDVVLKECFVAGVSERLLNRVCPASDAMKPHQDKALASFLDEARILSRLSHRNIVRVLQVFEENGTAYMVLPFLRGHDLLDVMDDGKAPVAPDLVVRIARKMLGALAHVHERNFLHCDVSPDNILVTEDGEPVLIDFGTARRRTQDYTGLSTVKDGYSAPEMYGAGGAVGPWTDVYSLGATLYQAIAGEAPVDAQTRADAVEAGRPDPLTHLQSRVAGYPAGFLASVDRALSMRPGARHASALEWLGDIGEPAAPRNVALMRRVVVKAALSWPAQPQAPQAHGA